VVGLQFRALGLVLCTLDQDGFLSIRTSRVPRTHESAIKLKIQVSTQLPIAARQVPRATLAMGFPYRSPIFKAQSHYKIIFVLRST
jgi:hypothetical protein